MRCWTMSMAVGFLLAAVSITSAQGKKGLPPAQPQEKKAEAAEHTERAKTLKEQPDKASKQKTPSVEELVTEALKNNPDIRVAESKLREADAELNRVRLQVTQKITTHQIELARNKERLAEVENNYRMLAALHKSGQASFTVLHEAQENLQKVKADIAKLEAELPYLLGTIKGYSQIIVELDGFSVDVGDLRLSVPSRDQQRSLDGFNDSVQKRALDNLAKAMTAEKKKKGGGAEARPCWATG